ncbi:MAG: ATP synthase subunit C [Treponema sp.]|nr:ATP synthase subunit C [Treponema sp.]
MKCKMIVIAFVLFACAGVFSFAQEEATAEQESGSAIKYIAAAVAVGIACLGGGLAVGQIGAAAMGAMSENAELSGKAMPFVGLAEGICLWGFLVGLLILIL